MINLHEKVLNLDWKVAPILHVQKSFTCMIMHGLSSALFCRWPIDVIFTLILKCLSFNFSSCLSSLAWVLFGLYCFKLYYAFEYFEMFLGTCGSKKPIMSV